jgi:hypothetical protein
MLSVPIMVVNIPVSVGELIDKITILEIKKVRVTDSAKLENIIIEYGALAAVLQSFSFSEIQHLYDELRSINTLLWETEDKIRIKEHDNEFDDGFIELARVVYYTNDKRSEIKNMINKLMGSSIIEEKQYIKYT